MNGAPLTPVTAPGAADRARLVRGGLGQVADRIRVVAEPFTGYFQSARYQYEYPGDGGTVREPVTRLKIRALITSPANGQRVAARDLVVRGAAWSGAAAIARVEVSVGGGPWRPAPLLGQAVAGCWQRFGLPVADLESGITGIRARAIDQTGQVQPEEPEWNPRGYGANVIHQIRIQLS